MIKTLKQAEEVQARRFNSGKRGHSKAVRDFLLKTFPPNGVDASAYKSAKNKMQSHSIKAVKKPKAEVAAP